MILALEVDLGEKYGLGTGIRANCSGEKGKKGYIPSLGPSPQPPVQSRAHVNLKILTTHIS